MKPLTKSVLTLLGLTVAALATDAAIHNKMCRSYRPSNTYNNINNF